MSKRTPAQSHSSTQAVQANPGGSDPAVAPDGVSSVADGRKGGGESGGGAYPNPRRGKTSQNDPGDFMGHGGQSEIGFHGTGQLGDQDVPRQDNANAPTKSR